MSASSEVLVAFVLLFPNVMVVVTEVCVSTSGDLSMAVYNHEVSVMSSW